MTRLPTRYGGGALGRRRARAATLLLFGLPGVAFAYQGQELGLEEVELPDEARQDPIFSRTGGCPEGTGRLSRAAPMDGGGAGVRLHGGRALAADAAELGRRCRRDPGA